MTVPIQIPVSTHVGNGVTTSFAYQFLIGRAADLSVKVAGVLKTIDVDYTITGIGNPNGGNVNMVAAVVADASIVLARSIKLERTTDYQYAGDFDAAVVNPDFDRIWMALQDAQYLSSLAVLLPAGDTAAPMTLPSVAQRANAFQAYDALGRAVAAAGVTGLPANAFIAPFLLSANAAAARSEIGVDTQIQSQDPIRATTTGLATAFALALTPAVTAYTGALTAWVTFHLAPGAAATLAIGAGAALPLQVAATGGTYSALPAGAFTANWQSRVTLNAAGTAFIVEDMPPTAPLDGSVTAAKLDGAQSGSAPIYGARSWGNFNGQGTIAIRASGNCSSITDTGAGTYRVNFATLMPDANYAALVWWTTAADGNFMKGNSADYTATGFAMEYTNTSGTGVADPLNVTFAVFR